jgi:hypothetical protein
MLIAVLARQPPAATASQSAPGSYAPASSRTSPRWLPRGPRTQRHLHTTNEEEEFIIAVKDRKALQAETRPKACGGRVELA